MLSGWKRESSISPAVTSKKESKSTLEEITEIPTWLRPSQYLSRIYSDILMKYKAKKHFRYSTFVTYKGKNARMKVFSSSRAYNSDYFVFIISIDDEEGNLLHWDYTFSWNGGWFELQLKLLCLLDP